MAGIVCRAGAAAGIRRGNRCGTVLDRLALTPALDAAIKRWARQPPPASRGRNAAFVRCVALAETVLPPARWLPPANADLGPVRQGRQGPFWADRRRAQAYARAHHRSDHSCPSSCRNSSLRARARLICNESVSASHGAVAGIPAEQGSGNAIRLNTDAAEQRLDKSYPELSPGGSTIGCKNERTAHRAPSLLCRSSAGPLGVRPRSSSELERLL